MSDAINAKIEPIGREIAPAPYVKVGDEYVFTMKDEISGNTITARAKIADNGAEPARIGSDTLALFPKRSANHRRILALLQTLPAPEPEPVEELPARDAPL